MVLQKALLSEGISIVNILVLSTCKAALQVCKIWYKWWLGSWIY